MFRVLKILLFSVILIGGFSSPAIAAPDRTPPSVTSVTPLNGSIGASVSVVPSATFSEPVRSTSVQFYLRVQGSNKNLAASLSFNSDYTAVSIRPQVALSYSTTYVVAITSARDLANNQMRTAKTWSFSTAALPVNQPPVAKIVVSPLSGEVPLDVVADASSSTDDSGVASYTFDFGDGTVVGPQVGSTATHKYVAVGNFTAKVTVRDAAGLSSSATASVSVSEPAPPPNTAPVAKIALSVSGGTVPLSVTADASGSTDTDVYPIESYTFDFGDGTVVGPQSSPIAEHLFSTKGTFAVTVSVRDTGGLTSTATASVEVYPPNEAPTAKLVVTPSSAPAPVVVTADGSTSVDDRGALSYAFDFGDGSSIPAQLDAKVYHRYAAGGDYIVSLTVVDSGGLSSSISVTIHIGAPPADVVNSVVNGSFETPNTAGTMPQGWYSAGHGGGTNTSTYEYLTTGHSGNRSVKIVGSGFGTGTAAWSYNPRPVESGARYVYTDWYQADAGTEVDATVVMSDGSYKYYYLGSVPASKSWSQVRYEFDMPVGAVSASVYHLVYQNGTLVLDDVVFGKYTTSPFSRGLVSVTFDDGYTDQYANAAPVLDSYGFDSTFYVLSGYLSSPPVYMTSSQIKDLESRGHDVQSHTMSHLGLTGLTSEQRMAELQGSQQVLSNTLQSPVGDLAAPYGTQNTDTISDVSKVYQSQRTMDSGYNSRDYLDPYRLRVKSVRQTTTPAQVQSWIEQANANHTWLILVYHQISSDTTLSYGTSPANFATEMQMLSASGITVSTVSNALQETAPQAGVILNKLAPVGDELIVNSSVEIPNTASTGPLNWLQGYWGTNTRSFTWPAEGHTGNRSLRVDISNFTDGQAKWYYPAVSVQGGQRYTFSDWYKSNVVSSVSLAYTLADGSVHYDGQDFAIPPSLEWKEYKLGVVLPPGAVQAFFAHGIGSAGYLQTDDFSMKKSTVNAGFSRGLVSITFDDASESIYNAVGVVDTYGWKTTQYIPTAGINKWVWTDAQIKSLSDRGHEIASHTVTHPHLTTLSDRNLTSELANSKKTLETITGKPVVSFSSPYGEYSPSVLQAISAAGYTNHRSVDVGYGDSYDFNAMNIHVQNLMSTTTIEEFNSWVNLAAAGHYYLVLVYHEITSTSTGDPGLDQYSVAPEMFASQLASIQGAGLTVSTVKDAVAELTPQKVQW